MTLLALALISAAVLLIAYFTYGRILARLFELDPRRETPAIELRDDVDYSPIEPKFLLGQHFSAIAAAGPIVGPILAGLWFGWIPAVLWILIGAIFIGGVHDLSALVASIRHKARSIAEVVREHMSERSYLMFLSFIWIALVYIIVAFTDITAAAFIGGPEWRRLGQEPPAAEAVSAANISESGGVTGGAIATSSLLYLALPIIMGLLLRYTRLSLGLATLIFLPLVGVTIWLGQYIPLDVGLMVQYFQPELTLAQADQAAHKLWDVVLLGYCLIAGAIPVWLLLQPRGHLGGYFLYAALIAGGAGVLFGGFEIQYDGFKGWNAAGPGGELLLPFLFITIACGACSGFHSLIASGTTSKQLRRETDARPIGYGAMLLEAMVAVLALATVMILSQSNASDADVMKGGPNIIYANGIGQFLSVTGIPFTFAFAFGLMAFTTFVYDTLDVCTRLGRFIVQELTGWHDAKGRWLGTTLTAGVPLFFVLQTTVNAEGQPVPAWRTFWTLFGASNQLLAALTLLGVTVWLWRTRRARWVWFVTGIPTVLMYVMSTWALVSMTWPKFQTDSGQFQVPTDPVAWAGVVLVGLAGLMLVEAIRVLLGPGTPPRAQEALAAQPAG
ncbi:MAG: carbon starvation CstA family protein [Pirellulales bacterium]